MSDYLLPFLLAFRPRHAADSLPDVVAWWRPYAVVALLTMMLSVLSHSFAVAITIAHLPPSATSTDVERIRDWLGAGLAARTFLLPLRVIVECGLSAILLLGLSRAFAGHAAGRFRGFFVLSLAASIFPLLARCAGIIRSSLTSAGTSISLYPPFSAFDLFPAVTDYRVIALLTSLNLFTLWYVGSVTLGLAVLCRCKILKAFLVAVAAWTVSTAFSITVLHLLRNAFQFRI
jgi:hypothetical protein